MVSVTETDDVVSIGGPTADPVPHVVPGSHRRRATGESAMTVACGERAAQALGNGARATADVKHLAVRVNDLSYDGCITSQQLCRLRADRPTAVQLAKRLVPKLAGKQRFRVDMNHHLKPFRIALCCKGGQRATDEIDEHVCIELARGTIPVKPRTRQM